MQADPSRDLNNITNRIKYMHTPKQRRKMTSPASYHPKNPQTPVFNLNKYTTLKSGEKRNPCISLSP